MCKVQYLIRKEGAVHKKVHLFVNEKKGCYNTFLSSSSVIGDDIDDIQEVLKNKRLCLHCKNTLKNALKKEKENIKMNEKIYGVYQPMLEYGLSSDNLTEEELLDQEFAEPDKKQIREWLVKNPPVGSYIDLEWTGDCTIVRLLDKERVS